ncbi:hypothetical protein [Haloquadratum walsbyi]|uniref:Uncharacterized protein n=1 Tax=Haloquadratum walsbyi J07HQW2 TaxID=1238425 RepID=U1N398_9EURY|nr:hypothetical protein [Haloquadratum walsbyi]ERG97354.1 MAG: hypothetical protein J07HQW2_03840 [Haloquadratum walsbyi J07HQW2]
MSLIAFLLFWTPIVFALLIGASYLGTKLALRSYFEDEDPPSDFIGLDDERK